MPRVLWAVGAFGALRRALIHGALDGARHTFVVRHAVAEVAWLARLADVERAAVLLVAKRGNGFQVRFFLVFVSQLGTTRTMHPHPWGVRDVRGAKRN